MGVDSGGSTLVLQTQARAIVFASEARTDLSSLTSRLMGALTANWQVGSVPLHAEVKEGGVVEMAVNETFMEALVAECVLSQVLRDLSRHADIDEEDVANFADQEQARRQVAGHWLVNECWMPVMAAYKIYDVLGGCVEFGEAVTKAADDLLLLCARILKFCVGLVEGYIGLAEGTGVVLAVRGDAMMVLRPAPEMTQMMTELFEEEKGEEG